MNREQCNMRGRSQEKRTNQRSPARDDLDWQAALNLFIPFLCLIHVWRLSYLRALFRPILQALPTLDRVLNGVTRTETWNHVANQGQRGTMISQAALLIKGSPACYTLSHPRPPISNHHDLRQDDLT